MRLYGFALLVLVACVVFTALLIYSYFSLHAPPVPDLRIYARVTPAVSRMYAADGTMLGEFAKEWREIVPFERMPQRLIDAFLAVEDHDFYHHGGLYWKGIGRALWTNITAGDFAQGGSTITQQVAKQFLGGEKSLSRKGKEAIMARRLEARYSKNAILAVYMNHIYLGAGAWGVAAAARRYFQKDLDQLTLAECALIAGLAKAPTAYSPIRSIKLATARSTSSSRRSSSRLPSTSRSSSTSITTCSPTACRTTPSTSGATSASATAATRSARRASGSRPRPSRPGRTAPTTAPTTARATRTSAKAGAAPSGGSTVRRARCSSAGSARCTAASRWRTASATSRWSTRSTRTTPRS